MHGFLKNKNQLYAAYKRLTSVLRTHICLRTGIEIIFHANGNQKRTGAAILPSHKINLKPKSVTRDKEAHQILTRGLIHQGDITIVNTYKPDIMVHKYIKQILAVLKVKIYTTMQK